MTAVTCAYCGEPKATADETWQQWQCASCSQWNDKPEPMGADVLFNCCTGHAEPVWSRFSSLLVSGVRDLRADQPGDETECVTCDDSEAQFWTVYGRTNDGDVEALTDAPTKNVALVIAGYHLCRARVAGVSLVLAEGLQ